MKDHVIATDITSGSGMRTPEPYGRDVRVLLSPFLQDGLEDFVAEYTEVPPHQQGSKHNHQDAAELWLFIEGTGRAIVGDRELNTGPEKAVIDAEFRQE